MPKTTYKKYEINDLGRRLIEVCRERRNNPVSPERVIVFMKEFVEYQMSLEKNKKFDRFLIDDFSTFDEGMMRMAGVLAPTELGWVRRVMIDCEVLNLVSNEYSWYNGDKYSHIDPEEGMPKPKTFSMRASISDQINELFESIHWTRRELLRSKKAYRSTKDIYGTERVDSVSLNDKDPAIREIIRQSKALNREIREYNKHETDEKSRMKFTLNERKPKKNEPKKRRLSGRAWSPICSMKKESEWGETREAHLINVYGTQEIYEYDVKSSIARVAWSVHHEGEWKPDDFDFYKEYNPYPGFFKRDVFKEILTRGAFIFSSNGLRQSIDKGTYRISRFWKDIVTNGGKLYFGVPDDEERIEKNLKRIGGWKWIRMSERWQRLKLRDKKRMASIIMDKAEKVYGRDRGADVFITESLIYVRLANILRRKYGVAVKLVYDCLYSIDSRLESLCRKELPRIARRVYNHFFKKQALQYA